MHRGLKHLVDTNIFYILLYDVMDAILDGSHELHHQLTLLYITMHALYLQTVEEHCYKCSTCQLTDSLCQSFLFLKLKNEIFIMHYTKAHSLTLKTT